MQIELRYKSVEAKRFSLVKGAVNINNNSTLTSVVEKELGLKINFVFTSNYEPNVGLIKVEGEMFLKDSEKNIKRVIKEWENSGKKNLPQDVAEQVHNTILANCIVEATVLSKEVQLPAPVPTPRVSMKKREDDEGEDKVKVDYIR